MAGGFVDEDIAGGTGPLGIGTRGRVLEVAPELPAAHGSGYDLGQVDRQVQREVCHEQSLGEVCQNDHGIDFGQSSEDVAQLLGAELSGGTLGMSRADTSGESPGAVAVQEYEAGT